MSRTIRRTSDKKRNKSGRSNFVKDYTFDWVPCYDAFPCVWQRIQLEGEELKKAYWKFHRDHHNSYGWGNRTYDRYRFEQYCRIKNKQEISRYLKDEDYEVFAHKPGCLSWER